MATSEFNICQQEPAGSREQSSKSPNKPFYTVDKFLGCVKLETFGTWYGWFGYILGTTTVVVYLIYLTFLIYAIKLVGASNAYRFFKKSILYAVILAIWARFSWELIQGVKTRNHTAIVKTKGFFIGVLVVTIFRTIIAFVASKWAPDGSILVAVAHLIVLAIEVYFLICMQSLYEKFKEETLPQSICVSSPNVLPS